MAQTLNGVLATMVFAGLSDDWRRARLPALASVAPKAARLVLPDQCRSVRATSHEAAGMISDPAVQSGLKAFADAFAC